MDYFDQADGALDLGDDLSQGSNFTRTTDPARSSPAEAPGQRLLKWLTWCVITFILAFDLALATVHTLARVVGMPTAKFFWLVCTPASIGGTRRIPLVVAIGLFWLIAVVIRFTSL